MLRHRWAVHSIFKAGIAIERSMRLADFFQLAWGNLQRNRTRTVMTGVGVMIGVAALLALLGYGVGLQQNARSEFEALDLYNTLRVTSSPSMFQRGAQADSAVQKVDWMTQSVTPITDDLLAEIESGNGVLAAFPELAFPVELEYDEREVVATAEAIPQAFADIAAYQPGAGTFFTTSQDSALLIAPSMARRLGFEQPEEIVGKKVMVTTASLNVRALIRSASAMAFGLRAMPIRKSYYEMEIAGVLQEDRLAVSGFLRVLVPLEYAKRMEKLTVFSTVDLLLSRAPNNGYPAARVHISDASRFDEIVAGIEEKGVYVTALRDQFRQLERVFVLLDLALGIIGFIALVVATVGIINTMMMNVMERTQEVGIMKAIGGDERDVQKLFIVESAAIGLLGGMAGLVLGYGLMLAAEWGVNQYLQGIGIARLDIFQMPWWLVLGVLGVALLVSTLAGLLPARRAARIEVIAALRHG